MNMIQERKLRDLYEECEGIGETDNKHDLGGHTKYGATAKLLDSLGYDIRDVDNDVIWKLMLEEFYVNNRVYKLKDDRLKTWNFIQAVNTYEDGIKAMQLCYNALYKRKVKADGIIGKNTLAAINSLSYHQVTELMDYMDSAMLTHYLTTAQQGSQYVNTRGWSNRLEKIKRFEYTA